MSIYLIVLLGVLNQIGLKGSKMLVALHALELGAGPLAIGILVALYAVFPLVLAVYAGGVSDRAGARWPMAFGSLGATISLLLPAALPGLWPLYGMATLLGVSNVFFHVSIQNLVGSIGDAEARTRNFGTFSLGAASSAFVAPLLVGFVIDRFGYEAAYLWLAAASVIPGIVLTILGRSIGSGTKAKRKRQTKVKELIADPSLRAIVITSGLVITGIDLFSFYMPIYGRSVGLSASTIGVILGAYAAAAFVIRIWMPRLARRFSEQRVLIGSLAVAGAVYLLFPFFEDALVLAALAFVLGLGLGCGQPLSIILTYNHSPADRVGEALGMRLTVNKFTQISVPIVFGSMGALLGIYPVFWASSALLLIGGYISRRATSLKGG
jgi:MFS family permease